MISKKIIAAALAALMSVSVLGTTAFAKTTDSTKTESSQSSSEKKSTSKKSDTQKSSAKKSNRKGHCKPEKVAEPENAIGKKKAKAAALKAAGVSESKVEKIKTFLVKLDDGTVAYRVSFKYGEKYYAYKINALTGKVAEKKVQTAEEHEASKKERGGHGANKSSKSGKTTAGRNS